VVFDPYQKHLHTLSHQQENTGELHKFSETLSDDFLSSVEHRNLLQQITRPYEKTLYVLNWVWPNSLTHLTLPDHYDTYIFLQYREPVDWSWFDKFCLSHKNQKIILLTQGRWPSQPQSNIHDNLFFIEYQHWHYRVARTLIDYQGDYKFVWPRPGRVLSLCNKPSFFKTLVTCYLHKHHATRPDVTMSWNTNLRKESCGSMTGFDESFSRNRIDDLCRYYHNVIKSMSISQGKFDTIDHYEYENWTDVEAFSTCAINLTNETYSPSLQNDRQYPGPFFTEKTRKAIMAGCAVVPIGTPYSYDQLKRFGFKIEYPWSADFDSVPGDLDRVEKVFEVIDEIMSYDLDWLQNAVKDCTEYNYYHIRSKVFLKHIETINQQAVEHYVVGDQN
jgi:hypothetical protein